ncbi:DeoR/GlpR family DNA-binding transcription regulator [Eubacterium aggregans]|uniref:DeoR/GlpR family DNA-binding transcription regulator n=1 Tax=Eubacterium aggregans TaxID=81409 RepID=UPI0023F4F7E6|nr:DeoR/GlpR family DNA-binding transcription regulator [Eubacterium aggregans]MDD4692318.1 DeoR/GlpR family DNA-binding transcription regulator [Eubacterium aggregans]
MLTEERQGIILEVLNERGAITVGELTDILETSESTIRRDLTTLGEQGLLKKVHGGATALESSAYSASEKDVRFKQSQYGDEKHAIGKRAADIIKPEDFVYIDAGTTTEALVEAITETQAVYVTNGLVHAEKLLRKGCSVYVPGGRLRPETEAIVGAEALEAIGKYHFTIGFFGTNGIDIRAGYTTPDVGEARIKQEAFGRCRCAYVLADASKFNQITPVTFGQLEGARIITNAIPDLRYQQVTEIVEVK